MTGPEHYRLAEALLDYCKVPGRDETDEMGRVVPYYPALEEVDPVTGDGCNTIVNALAAAQVHATLALAAAAAEPIVESYVSKSAKSWTKAIS